jgi:murein DD-endopeptidase MepM/ murein hydrolase activator NlpD
MLVFLAPAFLAPAPAQAAPQSPATAFRWPLDGTPTVTRAFDPPAQPWLPGHRGVDLAGVPEELVRAAGPGTVVYAGQVAGVGVISIDHAGGLRTTYEPVEPLVRAGSRVLAGTPVGRLLAGHPGCPVTACLHWGLRRGTNYLDPLALLGYGRIRLYPVDRPDPELPRTVLIRLRQAPAFFSRAGRSVASRSYSPGWL